jgi:hypothetical protein
MPIADDFAGIAAGMRALKETPAERAMREIREVLERPMPLLQANPYDAWGDVQAEDLLFALKPFEGRINNEETRREIAVAIRPFIPMPPVPYIRITGTLTWEGWTDHHPDQGPGWEGGSDGAE